MRKMLLAACGVCGLLGAVPAPGQTPPLPPHETDLARLPKVYAVGIRVADLQKSERFYREALGATERRQITPREIAIGFPGGSGINLVQAAPDALKGGDGPVGLIFQTRDIDGLAARVKTMGGTVVREPSDGAKTIGIRIAMIRDPDGARIEVIQFPAH